MREESKQNLSETASNSTSNKHGSRKRCLDDYEEIRGKSELGKGSYGQVKLVKEVLTGQYYALKIMSKRSIREYCTTENLK